mgnify:CR=1 FL=1
MRIGFDAKRYFHNTSGLGNHSRSIVDALVEQEDDHEVFLFDSKAKSMPRASKNLQLVHPKGYSPFWRQIGISNEIEKLKLDVYHGLSAELPLSKPRRTKLVVTIHDVIFIKFPAYYSFFDRLIYTYKTRQAIIAADIIICCSEATKKDMMDVFSVNEAKLRVIYQSCGNQYSSRISSESLADFKREHQLPEKYLLCVGKFESRKNHIRLINAWLSIPDEQRTPLVLVGLVGNTLSQINKMIEESGTDKVLIFPTIKTEDLAYFYQGAHWSIFPSEYEGFGIPVLESIVCHTPVLTSTNTSMEEITGVMDTNFNPLDESSIGKSLLMIANENIRQVTIDKQRSNLHMFNAKTIVNQHLDLYKSLVND